MSYTQPTALLPLVQRTPAGETSRERERLRRIVRAVCACGGRPAADPLACPACLVWHCVEALHARDTQAVPA